MCEDLSPGTKMGILLYIMCLLVAIILGLVQYAHFIMNAGLEELAEGIPGAIQHESLVSDATMVTLESIIIALVVGPVIVFGLFITNRGAQITDRICNWYCSTRKVGIHGRSKYALGEMDMDFNTFYTLFTENPGKYIIGSIDDLCTPIILYNSEWKNATDKIFVPFYSIEARKNCVQIHLSYKDQRRLFRLLKQSIYDEDYRFDMNQRLKMAESASYAVLSALEMRKDITEVVNAQNEQNVRTAAQCREIADRITHESRE